MAKLIQNLKALRYAMENKERNGIGFSLDVEVSGVGIFPVFSTRDA